MATRYIVMHTRLLGISLKVHENMLGSGQEVEPIPFSTVHGAWCVRSKILAWSRNFSVSLLAKAKSLM